MVNNSREGMTYYPPNHPQSESGKVLGYLHEFTSNGVPSREEEPAAEKQVQEVAPVGYLNPSTSPETSQVEAVPEKPLDLSGISDRSNASNEMEEDDRRRQAGGLIHSNEIPLTKEEKAILHSTNPQRNTAPHVQKEKKSPLRTLGIFASTVVKRARTLVQGTKKQAPTEKELAKSIQLNSIPGEKRVLNNRPLISDGDQDFPEHVRNFSMPALNEKILKPPTDETSLPNFSGINGAQNTPIGELPTPPTTRFGSPLLHAVNANETKRREAEENAARRARILGHSHKVLIPDTPDPKILKETEEVEVSGFAETSPGSGFSKTQPDFVSPPSSGLLFFDKDGGDTVPLEATQIQEDRRKSFREKRAPTDNSPETIPGIPPSDLSLPSSEPKKQSYKISAPRNPTVKRGLFSSLRNNISSRLARLIGKNKDPEHEKDKQVLEVTNSEFNKAQRDLRMEKVGAAIERATNAIDALNKKTEQKRKNLLEHVGDAGKSILKRIENIGDRFNDIPLKYKLPVGLAIAALGATGFPFVMPTLALATMYRAASGAGTYALLHHLLEKKYKDIESRGEKVSFLRKGTMEAGALAVAAFGSYYLSQFIGNIWGGLFDGGHGLVNPAQAPTPNIPVVVAPDITPVAVPTPDITPPVLPVEQITPVIVPPSIHTVLPNERLWDIVKNHLLESDTFKNLSLEAKNLEISKYIAYADQHKIVPNVHLIHTGDIIDFSKIDGKIPADILKHVKPFSH